MNALTVCTLTVLAMCFTPISCGISNIGSGKCPKDIYEKDNDFNMKRMFGTWYENATYYRFMGDTGKCAKIEIPTQNGDAYRFRYSELKRGIEEGHSGKLEKLYHRYKDYRYQVEIDYYTANMKLMDTNYDCWAVMHYCWESTALTYFSYVSIFLRKRTPDCLNDKTNVAVNEVLNHINLNLSKMTYNDHQGCKT